MKISISIIIVVAVGWIGCGKSSGEEPTGSSAQRPGSSAEPASASAAEAEPAGSFDLERFCAAVFAPEDARTIMGVPGLVSGSREGRLKLPAEMGECSVEERNEHGIPTASASLLADCRGLSIDVAKHREMARSLAGGERDEYVEIDLGRGGVYTRVFMLKNDASHTVTFVHATTPCSITVSALFTDRGPVEQLARHIHDRLNEANRPR